MTDLANINLCKRFDERSLHLGSRPERRVGSTDRNRLIRDIRNAGRHD